MLKEHEGLKLEPSRSAVNAVPEKTTAGGDPITDLKPAKVIAWIGASVGGLSIILAVVGFLALSAHDAMLGIPGVVQGKPDYIVIGGLFFGRSIIFALASLFFPKITSWIVLILFIASLTLIKYVRREKGIYLGSLFVTFIAGEFYALFCLIKPLQITNLLLSFSGRPDPFSSEIVRALLDNDMKWLEAQYGFIVLLLLGLMSLSYYLDRSLRRSNNRTGYSHSLWHWFRIPSLILLSICFFLLPRAYGVFSISNEYPEIKAIVRPSNSKVDAQSSLFLLREDEKNLILYEPASQSILSLKREAIEEYKITSLQPIFSTR